MNVNVVSPGFFTTLGTRMITGRDFSDADRAGGPPVVIVNESFARTYFGGANPIGRTLVQPAFGSRAARTLEVVGYVQDSVYRSLREPLSPTVYRPLRQQEGEAMFLSFISVVVRTAGGSPALLIKPLADALGTVHRDLALTFRPLEEQVDASLTQERLVAMLSGFFGALALLLAGLGLYGVTSYAVSRRRTELGIRMALGAAPAGVVRLVLRRVAFLVGLGIALGIVLAVVSTALARTTLGSLLYGLQPQDPATIALATVVLGVIGAAAGWIPARRASRIDPAAVLRQ